MRTIKRFLLSCVFLRQSSIRLNIRLVRCHWLLKRHFYSNSVGNKDRLSNITIESVLPKAKLYLFSICLLKHCLDTFFLKDINCWYIMHRRVWWREFYMHFYTTRYTWDFQSIARNSCWKSPKIDIRKKCA